MNQLNHLNQTPDSSPNVIISGETIEGQTVLIAEEIK
jgi:hypothetical protein